MPDEPIVPIDDKAAVSSAEGETTTGETPPNIKTALDLVDG